MFNLKFVERGIHEFNDLRIFYFPGMKRIIIAMAEFPNFRRRIKAAIAPVEPEQVIIFKDDNNGHFP